MCHLMSRPSTKLIGSHLAHLPPWQQPYGLLGLLPASPPLLQPPCRMSSPSRSATIGACALVGVSALTRPPPPPFLPARRPALTFHHPCIGLHSRSTHHCSVAQCRMLRALATTHCLKEPLWRLAVDATTGGCLPRWTCPCSLRSPTLHGPTDRCISGARVVRESYMGCGW
jgi:hypothetical protein